ncbi:hypothetical protein BZG02_02515 [Labilibaculum filiforme]|uniref:Uncharacterized protein n=1 Tax=Labilibaculum filiforme TaxID=1940526 RepID=A0A2N3I6G2_9BACT|nr:hypothetical protein [Labilibaculum filiforme]PKQ65895.1 hypothetical protein BZG02_02515 [Labilibaculum filiforme]
MDESWGNILYYVFIAIFVIVGALKKKKPVAVLPPDDGEVLQQDQTENPGGLETLFESLLGNEIPKPYVEPIQETSPEPEETMMQEYARLQKKKEEARMEAKGEEKESVFSDLKSIYNKKVEQEELEIEEEEGIDWRQAIIYKEILDRRYT